MDDRKVAFIQAYKNKACNVSHACQAIGISRPTYYTWRKEDKEFEEKVYEAEQGLIDVAENQLMENILKGKETSLIFFLTNRSSDRWKHKSEQQQTVRMEFDGDVTLDSKFKQHLENVMHRLGTPVQREL